MKSETRSLWHDLGHDPGTIPRLDANPLRIRLEERRDIGRGCCAVVIKEVIPMTRRRRFKQTDSLKDRLIAFANEVRDRASLLPSGVEKDDLLRKARQADTASHLDEWANSSGLVPPR